jgi:Undecaprenyl-phosphate galactose phosphotransferase WbaP
MQVQKISRKQTKMRENVKALNASDSRTKLLGVISYRGNARFRMGILLMGIDTISFVLAGLLAIGARVIFNEPWRFDLFPQILPVMAISLVSFALTGLYPAVGMSAVEELRKLVTTTTAVVLFVAAVSFWARNANDFSRLTLALTWLFSIVFLPVARDMIRTIGVRLNIWGEPVAIIGYGKQGQWALEFFQENAKLGLKPVVILDPSGHDTYPLPNIRVLKVDALYPKEEVHSLTDVKTALIIIPDVPAKFMNMISSNQRGGFERLILMPNLGQISSFGVMSFDFGGVLGLEVRHNLLDFRQQAIKRAMDVAVVVIGGFVISPILLILVLMLLVETRGSILYGHTRIGKDGKRFLAWKFRTMVQDADKKLQQRLEWETSHKLKDDPRVTKLGKILRRYSLDELPQLINVIKGEMSLVGPRPIVEDEVQHYGNLFDPYTWVRPGITGMWQVSGRSDTAYTKRVHFDEYYVRNWSIWLDIYILARTALVVLLRKGAY